MLLAELPPTIKYNVYVSRVESAGDLPSSVHATATALLAITVEPAAGAVNSKPARASGERAARRVRCWSRMAGIRLLDSVVQSASNCGNSVR